MTNNKSIHLCPTPSRGKQTEKVIFMGIISRKLLAINLVAGRCSSSIGSARRVRPVLSFRLVHFSVVSTWNHRKNEKKQQTIKINKPSIQSLVPQAKYEQYSRCLAWGVSPHHSPRSNCLVCLLLNLTTSSCCHRVSKIITCTSLLLTADHSN